MCRRRPPAQCPQELLERSIALNLVYASNSVSAMVKSSSISLLTLTPLDSAICFNLACFSSGKRIVQVPIFV